MAKIKEEKSPLQESLERKTWFDGKNHIAVEDMTVDYLRRAKLFAQRKEEELFWKCGQWADVVTMIETEAARRNVKLRDRRSEHQKNNRILKNAIEKL